MIGSFFAGVYALYHWRKIWGSGHSVFRKLAFMFEDLYQTYNLIFSWFALVCSFIFAWHAFKWKKITYSLPNIG
jgi:hypothetical protein